MAVLVVVVVVEVVTVVDVVAVGTLTGTRTVECRNNNSGHEAAKINRTPTISTMVAITELHGSQPN